MVNQTNKHLGQVRSAIRELFEFGKARKAQIGEDNVYDYSLGNPSVPAPQAVKEALTDIVLNTDAVALHGYTSAQGDLSVRKVLSEYINCRFQTKVTPDDIYMTCGAAASLCITLNAILNEGEEVITFAPFFPEYSVFTTHAGGKLIPVMGKQDTFAIDFDALEKAITPNTKAILYNSPNNPSGVVYTEEDIATMCELLKRKQEEYGHPIYVIADEPYRELVFSGVKVPFIMNYYANSIVCYSYSKSLSLPGERIGYIAVCPEVEEGRDVYAAICGAGRSLGYVCAPALFQKLIERIYDKTSDISAYQRNRDVLCSALREYGYTVVQPDGAFYLFVKALEEDASAFAEKAKEFELLLVPGDSFGVKGYVRISYCVAYDMIVRSLPAFKALAQTYQTK